MEPLRIEIPSLRSLVRHTLPNVLEGTVLPLVVFLVMLKATGVWGAMTAGLVLSYGLIARRALTGRRIPGVLILGALTLTARTALALASGSVFVYFLQPSLSTALVATAFLLSVAVRRPLAQRLAHDFCPFEPEVFGNRHVTEFFKQISLLWSFTQFANAAVTIWLLTSQSLTTYVVVSRFVSLGLTCAAITVSTLWFHRSMARNGILVARRVHNQPAAARD